MSSGTSVPSPGWAVCSAVTASRLAVVTDAARPPDASRSTPPASPTIRWRWSRRPAPPTPWSPSGPRPVARRAWSMLAEHQTAGRGRLDRSWVTPPRSALTFSVLLRPTVPAAAWPWLPLLTGHAVSTALRTAGFDASVKWPNDVLLPVDGEDRKVAGILVERVETPTGPAAVVGIGINVGMTADELPVPEATSLALAGERSRPDRAARPGPRHPLGLVRRLAGGRRGGRGPAGGVVRRGVRHRRTRRQRRAARAARRSPAAPSRSTRAAGWSSRAAASAPRSGPATSCTSETPCAVR